MLYFFLHISYEEKSDQWTYFQYLSKLCVYLTLVKTYSNIFFPHKGCRGWEKCCNFLSTIIFRYKIKSLKNQKHYERTLEKNLSFILCEIWTFISQQIESIKLKIYSYISCKIWARFVKSNIMSTPFPRDSSIISVFMSLLVWIFNI